MRKYRTTIKILILSFLFCATVSYSQDIKVDTIKVEKSRTLKIVTVMTVPKFILDLSGGYNSGALELSSHNGGFSESDFILGKNFQARNGFGLNLTGKLPLNKKGELWLFAVAGFARFQSNLFAQNTEEGSVAYNSFNGGVGIEYNFTSYHRVKYFVGFNPLISVISGNATVVNITAPFIVPTDSSTAYTIKSSVRIGYSLFMGLEYAFNKDFGLNVGLRFTHANLLSKNTEQVSPGQTTFGLQDNSTDPSNPTTFGGWKQFAYFSGFVGVSYFFGVKEQRYKLP